VQNASGRVIAGMNVSAQASRTRKKQMIDRFLPALREAAMKMRPLLIG
jgi:DNA-binding IclR family transcriptional regulator